MAIKELSVFVDESGDFGEYDFHSPFYIISLVLHDQTNDINNELSHLEERLSNLGWPKHCVHAGPIIRKEEDYKNFYYEDRKKILMSLMSFVRRADIKYTSFYVEKKHIEDSIEAVGKLSKQLSNVIKSHMDMFTSYDVIKVYYDNGQMEVTKMLSSVFSIMLDNVEFRKVYPSDYRLFQAADLICSLTLAELKMDNHMLSKSELNFFNDERTLKKNYLKPLKAKILK